MKTKMYLLAILVSVSVLAVAVGFGFTQLRHAKADGTCTPTGFYRDNINLTAALINPPKTFSGTVNATGCNIGIYYAPGATGKVSHAEVYGANYYGIVNDGANGSILNTSVHNIGEVPLNGVQHGVGIYFSYGSNAQGNIESNTIATYQKGGIVVNGASKFVKIDNNTVTGQGPIDYIAQNGIQVGYGVQGEIKGNTVTGNSYTGAGGASSGGILIVGGSYYGGTLTTNIKISGNILTGNDVGVFLSNLNTDPNHPNNAVPPTTPTHISVSKNTISDSAVINTSGNNPGAYQAGVSEAGNLDVITSNSICGAGYTPVSSPSFISNIDISYGYDVTVYNNTSCSSSSSITPMSSRGAHNHGYKAIRPVKK